MSSIEKPANIRILIPISHGQDGFQVLMFRRRLSEIDGAQVQLARVVDDENKTVLEQQKKQEEQPQLQPEKEQQQQQQQRKHGTIAGARTVRLSPGMAIEADTTIEQAAKEYWDLVVLVGGLTAVKRLVSDKPSSLVLQSFLKSHYDKYGGRIASFGEACGVILPHVITPYDHAWLDYNDYYHLLHQQPQPCHSQEFSPVKDGEVGGNFAVATSSTMMEENIVEMTPNQLLVCRGGAGYMDEFVTRLQEFLLRGTRAATTKRQAVVMLTKPPPPIAEVEAAATTEAAAAATTTKTTTTKTTTTIAAAATTTKPSTTRTKAATASVAATTATISTTAFSNMTTSAAASADTMATSFVANERAEKPLCTTRSNNNRTTKSTSMNPCDIPVEEIFHYVLYRRLRRYGWRAQLLRQDKAKNDDEDDVADGFNIDFSHVLYLAPPSISTAKRTTIMSMKEVLESLTNSSSSSTFRTTEEIHFGHLLYRECIYLKRKLRFKNYFVGGSMDQEKQQQQEQQQLQEQRLLNQNPLMWLESHARERMLRRNRDRVFHCIFAPGLVRLGWEKATWKTFIPPTTATTATNHEKDTEEEGFPPRLEGRKNVLHYIMNNDEWCMKKEIFQMMDLFKFSLQVQEELEKEGIEGACQYSADALIKETQRRRPSVRNYVVD